MDFKELIFVSGKGGTGKTTFSLLLAKSLASQGKRVLLAELATRSSACSLANLSVKPTYKPVASSLGFDLCLLQGLDCLVEYVGSMTGIEKIAQKIFEASIIKTLVNVAPGLNDLSVLGKLTSAFRGHGPAFDYDHVIVDAHSTGSFLSLLKAPQTLGASVSTGPLKTQSEAIDRVLRNRERVQYFFISLFEDLPVDELEDTLAEFRDDIGEQMHIVMNKKIEDMTSSDADDPWQKFVSNRLIAQHKQGQRVRELWTSVFSYHLVTEPLYQHLKGLQGELLRPL